MARLKGELLKVGFYARLGFECRGALMKKAKNNAARSNKAGRLETGVANFKHNREAMTEVSKQDKNHLSALLLWRASFHRALIMRWKKYFRDIPPHLVILSIISVIIIPVVLGRYFSKHFAGMLENNYGGIVDYLIYYKAAIQFRENPLNLYDIINYKYPPASIIFFYPLSYLPFPYAYSFHTTLMAILMVTGIYLILDLYRSDNDTNNCKIMTVLFFLIAVALGPVYQNLKGQVNPVILVSCLGFLTLLKRDRPFAASVVLGLGIWIKLYPAVLVLIGIQRKTYKRFIAGLLIAAIFPVVLLNFIPFSLYAEYFFDRIHTFAGITNLSALNQSLTGFLSNLVYSPSELAHYNYIDIEPWIKTVNLIIGLLLLIAACVPFIRNPVTGTLPSAFSLMALIPVISPLGWEHAYLLAVPLVLYLLLDSPDWRSGYQVLFSVALFLFMLPKIPDSIISRTCRIGPHAIHCLFYSRYLFIVLAFLVPMLRKGFRRDPKAVSSG